MVMKKRPIRIIIVELVIEKSKLAKKKELKVVFETVPKEK